MIEAGQLQEGQIAGMKQQIEETLSKIGEQTMKAMAIRYAADAEKAAGVDVSGLQKRYLWVSGGKMMRMALLMAAAAIAVSL